MPVNWDFLIMESIHCAHLAITGVSHAQIHLPVILAMRRNTECPIQQQKCATACQFTMTKSTLPTVSHVHSVVSHAHIRLYAWPVHKQEPSRMVFANATSSTTKTLNLFYVPPVTTVAKPVPMALSALLVLSWWAEFSTQQRGSAVAFRAFMTLDCKQNCASSVIRPVWRAPTRHIV